MMKIFDENPFKAMKKGMDYSELQQRHISNNIANLETPGFKGKRVKFQEALQEIVDTRSTLALSKTNARHMPSLGSTADARTVTLNTIGVDSEMAELAKNNLLYNTYTEILMRKQDMIKTAIR